MSASAVAVPIWLDCGQANTSGSARVQIVPLAPRFGLKPTGNETLTVLLGVSPAAWVRWLVIATALPGVAGLKLICRCGAWAAEADAAGTRIAAQARRVRRSARDRMTQKASMLRFSGGSGVVGEARL